MPESNPNMPDRTKKKNKRWRWLLLVLLAVLFIVGVSAWLYAQNVVATRIETQLSDLGLGSTKIGNISIGLGGVEAHNIELAQSIDDAEPAITLERLSIRHPIVGLASGDKAFDALELQGLRAVINVDELCAGSDFDFSTIDLPTKNLRVSDSSIVLRQLNRSDFLIAGVEAQVKPIEDELSFNGRIGQLLDGEWELDGTLSPEQNSWKIKLATDSLEVTDGKWQRWPMLPSSIESYIRVDATAQAEIELRGTPKTPFKYLAEIEIEKAKLNLPAFDLPIDIAEAKLTATDGIVSFKNVVASTDGSDQISGLGSTSIAGFPVSTQFDLNFDQLNVDTIRKLAPAIPQAVAGRATGKAKGSVDVERSLRTTLKLSGTGQSSSASFGSIKAETSTTQVDINPLILDSKLKLESLDGSLVVKAQAKEQSADDIFASLDLQDLSRQLEINAKGSGDFHLELPLATAERIETWRMQVEATAPSATISKQPVQDVGVSASLANGNLQFTRLAATAGETSASNLFGSVDWPISTNGNHPSVGRFELRGQQVPPNWLIGVIQRQIDNASETGGAATQSAITETLSQLSGGVTFNSKFELPATQPDAIEQWKVDGEVTNSSLIAQGHRLGKLSSQLRLREGELSFPDTNGEFENGGSLTADGKLDITKAVLNNTSVQAVDVPLSWIADVGSTLNPGIKTTLQDMGLGNREDAGLDGNVSVEFDLDEALQFDSNDWSITTRITSKQLGVKGQELDDIVINGKFDAGKIRIENARADLPAGGKIDLQGTWLLAEQSGEADLQWKQLPLDWMASFRWPESDLVGGATSGKIKILKLEDTLAGTDLPFAVEGTVSANQVSFAGFKTRELEVDLQTVENVLTADNFRASSGLLGINLTAGINLNAPFEFSAAAKIDTLALSKIFALPSVTERIGETKSVTGIANGDFKIGGQLQGFDWKTSGDLTIRDGRIDNKPLSDVAANWSHLGSDWRSSKATLSLLGGKIEMTELTPKPSRVKVEISDINAMELSTFTKLPFEFDGTLSGDASLNEWDLSETRWADLNLKGASIVAGPTEFGDLSGSAELRKGKLKYSVDGRLLDGKFTAEGETDADDFTTEALKEIELPVSVQFTNGALNGLYKRSNAFSPLRPLAGSLSANADLTVFTNRLPVGSGLIKVSDVTWQNKRLTREVSSKVKLAQGVLLLENLRADLKRGEISGRASIPLSTSGVGSYQLDIRQFDLQKFLELVADSTAKGAGYLNSRISGQLGRTIDGRGSLAISRAKLLGLAGRTFRVPIQFQYSPLQQQGRVEFRQSTFQLFDGNVSGSATLDLGRTVNIKTDLRVSKIDTEKMFVALANVDKSGQGDVSGHLILKGNSVRSLRDLKGSFRGSLERADAFQLPILDTVGRFFNGNQLQAKDFESDDIDLRLSAGRIEFRRFNLSNSLAKVAISGSAFLDGRLNLDLAAQVGRLNQPSFIDELIGSPLTQFRGTPVAVFAQAADFLSERLVFLKIGGTFQRPQVRPAAGKQLQSEAIRYFLRGTQILPNTNRRDN